MTLPANRKRRARETEIHVAAAFACDGWPYAVAVGTSTQGRDVTGLPGIACEVKARKDFDPMAHLRQAERYANGDLPIVVMRPNGYGPAMIDQWPAFLSFGALRRLLRQAGYGDPLDDQGASA